jgi:hypothetical protein
MAIELKCDVTGSKVNVVEVDQCYEEGKPIPPDATEKVQVGTTTVEVQARFVWPATVMHVSKAARATALRKAAAQMTKAGAGQGKKKPAAGKPNDAKLEQPPEA